MKVRENIWPSTMAGSSLTCILYCAKLLEVHTTLNQISLKCSNGSWNLFYYINIYLVFSYKLNLQNHTFHEYLKNDSWDKQTLKLF